MPFAAYLEVDRRTGLTTDMAARMRFSVSDSAMACPVIEHHVIVRLSA